VKKCVSCGIDFKPRCHQKRCEACLDKIRKRERHVRDKVCLTCGVVFTPRSGRHVYCTRDCNPALAPKTVSCLKCGERFKRSGNEKWCVWCRPRRRPHQSAYRKYLKALCARCGFTPEHACQLDGHHIDGDHQNNSPENIETLCANCHRLDRVGLLAPPRPTGIVSGLTFGG
jgi:hypothetical protein